MLHRIYDDLKRVNRFAVELAEIGAAADVPPTSNGPEVVAQLVDRVPFLEVASITSDTETRDRVIRVKLRDGGDRTFDMSSHQMEPLCYPVLFPNAEAGWGANIEDSVRFYQYLASRILQPECLAVGNETMKLWCASARQFRPVSRFQASARVMSVYLVDMVSRAIDFRLQWMKNNQATIFGGTR